MSSLTLPARVDRPARRAVRGSERQVRAARRPARPAAAPLRLTRRGRALLLLTVLALAATALLVLRAPATASTGAHRPGAVASTVTVAPGETLWQIARRTRPGADPRDTVDRIMEMNGLTRADVRAGQQIFVPAG